MRDSIALESAGSPYVNLIAVRRQDRDAPWVARLLAAYQGFRRHHIPGRCGARLLRTSPMLRLARPRCDSLHRLRLRSCKQP
ncbi:hypothetical protein ACFQS7_26425 [Dankookia sp. GCM10030260]|uniref:hypothetical protein n=1 Tax=Dankookia sp. GCM10030260 TaxID=3273390 RepID=UPI003614E590